MGAVAAHGDLQRVAAPPGPDMFALATPEAATAFMTELGIHLPPALTGAPFGVVGTHTLVRSEICVDPASGAAAVDAVSRTLVPIADCAAKGFSTIHGLFNVPAVALILVLTSLLVLGIRESARRYVERLRAGR